MLVAGSVLQGRYRILRPLGSGGFATVYLAEDGRLGGRQVAVKEFNPGNVAPADRAWATTAFEQEAMVLARLNHPNIASVTDFFQEGGLAYLVMEYVPGETLQEAWQRAPGGRFPEAQVVAWVGQITAVLDYLHNQSPPIIFRDLKPSNVIVQPDGTLKLVDFGIARYFKPGQARDTQALGTPGYAAPEQYGQGQADARTDVYALGAMAHQLLTGHDPAQTPFNFPPLRGLAPHVSISAEAAVSQALDTARLRRPASAGDFYRLMRSAEPGWTQPPRKPEVSGGQPAWLPWAVVGAIVAVVALVVVFVIGPKNGGETVVEATRPPEATEMPAATEAPAPTESAAEPPVESTVEPTTSVPKETSAPDPTATPMPEPSATPPPTELPLRDQIVFSSRRDDDAELFIMDADGNNQTQLTFNGSEDDYPAVSPDGSMIAFQSNRDGNWEVYVMPVDGGEQRRLTSSGGDDRLPNWSPDGRQIVYNSDRDGDFEVFVMDRDGGNNRQVTFNSLRDGHTSWSVWNEIVLNLGQDHSDTWEIYLMDLNGNLLRQLTDNGTNDWSAQLVARRPLDRLSLPPSEQRPGDLCHERRREQPAGDLQQRRLRVGGGLFGRRPVDRLYQRQGRAG